MIKDRLMDISDEITLGESLALDEHHHETTVDFFKQPGTMTKVYEDEQGPICFARATKSLRIDIQFLDNDDRRRNATALAEGFGPLAATAKENGFTEIVFTTNMPDLAKFCVKVFGYEIVSDAYVLRKYL